MLCNLAVDSCRTCSATAMRQSDSPFALRKTPCPRVNETSLALSRIGRREVRSSVVHDIQCLANKPCRWNLQATALLLGSALDCQAVDLRRHSWPCPHPQSWSAAAQATAFPLGRSHSYMKVHNGCAWQDTQRDGLPVTAYY